MVEMYPSFIYSTKGWKSPAFLDKKFSVVRKRKTGRMNPTPTFEITALSSKAITGGWIPASAGTTQRGAEIASSLHFSQ